MALNPLTRIQKSLHGFQYGFNVFGDLVSRYKGMDRVIAPHRPGNLVRFHDDFFGDVLADEWLSRVGSDGQAVAAAINNQENGVVRLVTGDDGTFTMAVNGTQLDAGALNWKANRGGLFFETRIALSAITDVALFVGFTDQVAALEMPVNASGSGNGITTGASDAVGIMFDTAMTADNFWGVGVKGDTDATAVNLGSAPVAATFVTLTVIVDQDENATFYINGAVKGRTALAVTKTVALTPVIAGFSRVAAVRNIDVDFITVEKNRA